MHNAHIIPVPTPLPTAPATDSQRQALRELAEKVGQHNRSRILGGLSKLTYKQALQQVGDYYQMAKRVPTSYTRSFVVPDDSLGSLLPKGSLVLLRTVSGSDLAVGDLAMCTDKYQQVSLLGQVCHVKRGRLFNEHQLTLAQQEADHTLWANRPYIFWYRVEVTCLAC
jgi:hypothetical protein